MISYNNIRGEITELENTLERIKGLRASNGELLLGSEHAAINNGAKVKTAKIHEVDKLLIDSRGKPLSGDMKQRLYVSPSSEDGKRILVDWVLRDYIECLEKNLEAYTQLQSKIKPYGLDESIGCAIERFPFIDEAALLDSLSKCGADQILNKNKGSLWNYEEYITNESHPEHKIHPTTAGFYCRSKSEALIAEELTRYGLEYRYEQLLPFKDVMIFPDFLIKRADGKVFVWEHMGMLENEGYRKAQIKKLGYYMKNGIVVWDNLILTWDSKLGTIDPRRIRFEIENNLLVR